MTYPYRRRARARVRPSPVFLAILALAAVSGFGAWNAHDATRATGFMVFVFVMSAWILTLCLHEFAHAFGAWLAGDQEVESRGYLTLNPLRYAHPVLSIVLPVVFIALGGIGLPGGAVYLHSHQFRTKLQRAAVSVAGPLVNLVCGVALLAVVAQVDLNTTRHQVFWFAVSFLGFLQMMAAVLNLLPIPGLDGYGAIEAYVKPDTQQAMNQVKPYGMLLVFALLQVGTINQAFFDFVYWLYGFSGVPRLASQFGYTLVKFWALH